MKFITILFILVSINVFSQNTVQLRDVSFIVPAEFRHTVKENKKMDYDLFHENGRIHRDSLLPNPFSTILYQYYENPGGTEHPEVVLRRLTDHMAGDFKRDTLVINADDNYCIARYTVMGQTYHEINSLGENGFITVQLKEDAKSHTENLKTAEVIAKSIKHSGEYRAEYNRRMEQSADSSKIMIISLVILILITLARKYVKKAQENKSG